MKKRWSIEEVMELERSLIRVVREHAIQHGRTVSAIRSKAMNLLLDIQADELEAA